MIYHSTRGEAALADFETVLLSGLATDGGLYVPREWPSLDPDRVAALREASYPQAAAYILSAFTGETFSEAELLEMAESAYAGFDHDEIAPLTKVGDADWILELYHGPTLAFKDFAMQILGKMFDRTLAKRNRSMTIIAATSGDTGAAAIDALKDCKRVNAVVLHPEGRVTDVQRRMMTCVNKPNVQNIAVGGDFDQCQAIVKELFADRAFVDAVQLSGVNSINWARIAAQVVYYFTTIASLGLKAGETINFVVPTGNFGDVYAGYVAKKLGAPIGKLGVATNRNDILFRAITKGDYSSGTVVETQSPSMDIQVASNFERLLFDVYHEDSTKLADAMKGFKESGILKLSEVERAMINETFLSVAVDENGTIDEMSRHYEKENYLIDPHTAVARNAARTLRNDGALSGSVVTLSTAHPAKFPDAVRGATGVNPDLPARYSDLFSREEFMIRSAPTPAAVRALIMEQFSMEASAT